MPSMEEVFLAAASATEAAAERLGRGDDADGLLLAAPSGSLPPDAALPTQPAPAFSDEASEVAMQYAKPRLSVAGGSGAAPGQAPLLVAASAAEGGWAELGGGGGSGGAAGLVPGGASASLGPSPLTSPTGSGGMGTVAAGWGPAGMPPPPAAPLAPAPAPLPPLFANGSGSMEAHSEDHSNGHSNGHSDAYHNAHSNGLMNSIANGEGSLEWAPRVQGDDESARMADKVWRRRRVWAPARGWAHELRCLQVRGRCRLGCRTAGAALLREGGGTPGHSARVPRLQALVWKRWVVTMRDWKVRPPQGTDTRKERKEAGEVICALDGRASGRPAPRPRPPAPQGLLWLFALPCAAIALTMLILTVRAWRPSLVTVLARPGHPPVTAQSLVSDSRTYHAA
jgi:hypothetical protein